MSLRNRRGSAYAGGGSAYAGEVPGNSGRPALQSSIKIVNRFVIDAQGVVQSSQSTKIQEISRRIPGLGLAIFEEFCFGAQIRS